MLIVLCSQRGMLARLAARLRARQGGEEGGDGEGEVEGEVLLDDDCRVGGLLWQ